MSSKIKLIDKAYSKLEISGLTFNPTPEDVTLAVDELESMMAELDSRNACVGYNFEDEPEPSSESYIPKWAENAIQTNVAVRLAADFGKVASPSLQTQANQSMSNFLARTAKYRHINPPNRQAAGSGNTLRFDIWRRYYRVEEQSPLNCSTQIMSVNDEATYTVDYTEYLKESTILSYTLEVSDELTLLEQSNTDTSVVFKVKATESGTQKAIIQITTVDGRVDNRTVYFTVLDTQQANHITVT